MLSRFREIFLAAWLGLIMWVADAVMHTLMPPGDQGHRRAFLSELLMPEEPVLIVRALFVGFALCAGSLLWRLNRRERSASAVERQLQLSFRQVEDSARLIAHHCAAEGTVLTEAGQRTLRRIGWQAERITTFLKSFPDQLMASHGSRSLIPFQSAAPGVIVDAGYSLDPAVTGHRRPLLEKLAGGRVAEWLTAAAQRLSIMVAVGLFIRLAVVCFAYEDQLSSERGDFEFGWELGRIARALVLGQGLSSPLWGETGPTAWLPPVNAFLLAGVFKVFGIYTAASTVAILSLNGVFSALTAVPVFYIARTIFGQTVAVYAGWAWAFFPFAIYIAAFRVWGESLDALLVSLLLLLTLHLAETNKRIVWAAGGLLAGLAALTNPNALAVTPGLWAWAAYRLRRNGEKWKTPLTAAVLALLVALAPWVARNYRVFGELLPLRSNFWLEFSLGNNEEAWTMQTDASHPASNPREFARYQSLGELRYMDERRVQSLAFIAAQPSTFALLTLRRIVFVWTGFWSFDARYLRAEPARLPLIFFNTVLTGLMAAGLFFAWRSRAGAPLPLLVLIAFQPLVYYITHPAIEYRHQVDPVIVTLAVFGMLKMISIGRRGGNALA